MRILTFLLAALLVSAGVARAQQPPTADAVEAHALFDKGMAHFHLEEYPQAIQKWEEGFRIKPVPEFLYNIAQAYRLSKQADKALSFYKKFLRMRPDAPNRAEVEHHIRDLNRLVNEQERTSNAPPTAPIPQSDAPSTGSAPPVAETPPPPATVPAPVVTTAPPAGADLTAQPAEKPVTKRAWFWAVVGGGAAIVVAAVVVGVVVGTHGDSTKTLPTLRF